MRRWQPPTNTIHRLEIMPPLLIDRWIPSGHDPFVTFGVARMVAQNLLEEDPARPVRIVTYRARTVREIVPKKKPNKRAAESAKERR